MKNQRIVVLGGTQGIGLAVARQAAEQGAEVIVVSSKQKNVDAVRLPNIRGIVADLRRGFDFANVGPFDHLIYTAGEELMIAPLAGLDLDAARRFFELRYWGALAAIKGAKPYLKESIVLTGGTAGTKPHPGFSIGASICAAMEGVTRALAAELAPIRVNIVVPGFVDTGLWSNIPEKDRAAMFREAAAKLPVRRIGTPDDVAEHYLSFMRGRYTTGQSIIVDGGGVLG